MCWGERTENRCPIDHSVEIKTRWFSCQHGLQPPCHDSYLVPHHTSDPCTDCQHEFHFSNEFQPTATSPTPRDWETFKSEFRNHHDPCIPPTYPLPSPATPPTAPTMIQNLPGPTTDLPSYTAAMSDTPPPPTWRALHLQKTTYRIGCTSVLASANLTSLTTTLTPLFRRLQRLRPKLLPNTRTSTTVTFIRESLQTLESNARDTLLHAQDLEAQMMRLVHTVGFLVSVELQREFERANEMCKALFMRMVDDVDVDAGVVGRRFGDWIAEIERNGEFRGRSGVGEQTSVISGIRQRESLLPDESTPLIVRRLEGVLVEVVRFDVGDLFCLVFGAVAWFVFLFLLWAVLG